MKDSCILCDFDGTITEKDGLYNFFLEYANTDWQRIETLWEQNKISSKECLQKELGCIPDLNEKLIENYIKTVTIDPFFKEFYELIKQRNIDFYIVSDGVDCFINKILEYAKIEGIKVISNHLEFNKDKFILNFPYDNINCKKSAGTCKCKITTEMKKKYKKVIYIGDGTSDYCVSNKADELYAKKKLCKYCQNNNINYKEFKNFKDIIEYMF